MPYTRVPSSAIGDWSSTWRVFTLDWTPSWITMAVDGELYANFDTQSAALAHFTDPLFLALTACVMDRVPPGPADVFPLKYYVDVRDAQICTVHSVPPPLSPSLPSA